MALVSSNSLTTKHHCCKAASDAVCLNLLGRDHCVDYTHAPLASVKQLYVTYSQETPPFSGGSLLSKGEKLERPRPSHQRSGGSFAVHAR